VFARARGCRRAYYSPAMEAARPRTRGRRLRRGSVERPLNARLVRAGFVVVIPAVLASLFSISTTGTLQRSPLEPLFDAENAAAIAETMSALYPSRVPGSEGAGEATLWYRETVASLGLSTEEDLWTEDLADLGTVELRNVVTVVPGRSDETIVVVAHRDNAGTEERLGDNASGTAALIELARGFARQDAEPVVPQRTLVLVSTDAGSYGGAGAARFAETSAFARSAIAVVVLDGLGGRGRPRLALAGDRPVSPARALVRTAAARIQEQVGVSPSLPAVPAQLVDLGLPFAGGEQGRFLEHEIAAVTLTTSEHDDPAIPAGDPARAVDVQRLGQLGRATEALLGSLDRSVGGAFRTPDSLFIGDRAASGWTVRLVLVLAVVPFALGLVDLLVRGRRRGLPFAPALRALRTRLGLMLVGGLLIWLGAIGGVFPTGAPLPLAPFASLLDNPPLAGLALLACAFAVAWLVARRRLLPAAALSSEERLAGLAVALGAVGVVAIALALTKPYALVFVLPSLYAWLWLPLEGRAWQRLLLFVLGLAGPVLGLVVLSNELGVSVIGAALYVVGLTTVGYLPLGAALLTLVWLAGAIQVGALAFGRYGPYAGGAEPPRAGPVWRVFRGSR
jgi:Zn-dependent M28 family amino/carboxypeptidase